MNDKKWAFLSGMIVIAILFATSVRGETIQDLQREKQENQANQAAAEQQAGELESSKQNLEGMVIQFNQELESYGTELNGLEIQITDKQKEIKKTKKKIKKAEKKQEDQYKSMKDRIQFLFEAGDTSYLEIFLNSKTLAESLNKAEYFSQLYQYDREMLRRYQQTLQRVQKQKQKLVTEKGELDNLKQQTEQKQLEVTQRIQTTSEQIRQFTEQIAEAEAKAAEYENKAAQAEAQIKELELEARRAEEERLRLLREQAAGAPAYEYSGSDLDLLAALIQAEAENQPYEGKLAVGSVVLNRIRSSYYPNNMMGVLYQPYQFTPVTVNNRFAMILAKGANSECYAAAREVLDGRIVGDWLYFRMNDGSRTGTVIGDHVFY